MIATIVASGTIRRLPLPWPQGIAGGSDQCLVRRGDQIREASNLLRIEPSIHSHPLSGDRTRSVGMLAVEAVLPRANRTLLVRIGHDPCQLGAATESKESSRPVQHNSQSRRDVGGGSRVGMVALLGWNSE
jgi:hypothetical protein